MKKIIALLLTLCCCTALFAASGSTTPEGWYDDFDAAQAEAKKTGRPMLLLFTGSDWCGFCIKLRKNALDKSDFKGYARKHLVLVYIDFPRAAKMPKELRNQNRQLAVRFGAKGGVPNTLIVTPDGKVVGRIGGCPRNPKDYLRRVREIVRKSGR